VGDVLLHRHAGDCADPHRADHRPAGLTGGVNGITDLKTLLGWDIRTDSAKLILYFVNAGLLFGCIFIGRFILASKLGRLLLAMRDKEDRVRFSGYDVASFKIFVFCVAAAFSAIGGAMFTLQVGFMSPSFVGIVPSIEMVIFAAVGGRMSLLGAVYGALLVNYGKTYFPNPSRPVAVPDGRAVHRRGHVLPQWPGRLVGQPWAPGVAKLLRRTTRPCEAPGGPPRPKSWRPSHDRRRL
jgi:urea transport system permease protein